MIPSGTRFIGFSESVDLTERRSASVNAETAVYTVDDFKGYKVYTALLTQSGGDNILPKSNGLLTIGITYVIFDNIGNPDFTNVGATNNDIGTYFVATGTTPNSWGNVGDATVLKYNTGAPVVTVLENTIGNIWFEYYSVGSYTAQSNDLFTIGKTTVLFSPNGFIESPVDIYNIDVAWGTNNRVSITSYYNNNLANDTLNYNGSAMIEIRVYN